jgi:hypothetical protein
MGHSNGVRLISLKTRDLILPYKEVGGLDGHLLRYHLKLND